MRRVLDRFRPDIDPDRLDTAKVPGNPGLSVHERLSLRRVFTTPCVRPVLAVVIAWMLAHHILYTDIAPFVAPAGLTGRIDLVLLVFGTDVALSMNVVALLVLAFVIAWSASAHGFRPGWRSGGVPVARH